MLDILDVYSNLMAPVKLSSFYNNVDVHCLLKYFHKPHCMSPKMFNVEIMVIKYAMVYQMTLHEYNRLLTSNNSHVKC